MEDRLTRAVLYAILGGLWGARGIYDNVVKGGEPLDLLHLSTTLITFSAAGFVVGLQGDELEPGTLEAAAAVIAAIVDKEVSPHLEDAIKRAFGRTTIDT